MCIRDRQITAVTERVARGSTRDAPCWITYRPQCRTGLRTSVHPSGSTQGVGRGPSLCRCADVQTPWWSHAMRWRHTWGEQRQLACLMCKRKTVQRIETKKERHLPHMHVTDVYSHVNRLNIHLSNKAYSIQFYKQSEVVMAWIFPFQVHAVATAGSLLTRVRVFAFNVVRSSMMANWVFFSSRHFRRTLSRKARSQNHTVMTGGPRGCTPWDPDWGASALSPSSGLL